MENEPTAFHGYSFFDVIETQLSMDRLDPLFLRAVLDCYGLCVVRKIGLTILPVLMERFDTTGRALIAELVFYLMHFPAQAQYKLHEHLVAKCEAKRFDGELLDLTARAIVASAPCVSPSFGPFLEIAKRSVRKAYVFALVRPLLDPKGPAPRTPISDVIHLADEDKVDVGVQETPDYAVAETQHE
jgi:hypothetical protein